MKKMRLIKPIITFTLLIALFSSVICHADTNGNYQYDGYVYDTWGLSEASPAAFSLETVINDNNMPDYSFTSIEDVCTSSDGRIFLADKTGSRVNVFESDGTFIISLKVLRSAETGKIAIGPDGNQISLNSPSGLYYHEKNNELYIADSGTKQVFILDGETYRLIRTIDQPANLTGDTDYIPYKVTVDFADRIYVIVKSSHEGIVEINEDGSFSRYFGVNEPSINLIAYFWKSIATDVQKEKMGKTYAPAFTNLTTDSEGFIYAVTNDASASDMIFRLNSSGENVIREMTTPLIGELNGENSSSFVDICVTNYGVYACLDESLGRIFLYDFDGQQLNVFGGYGNTRGQFRKPTSISWLGDKLVVTDTELRSAFIFAPTDFGKVMLKASEEYYFGHWDAATAYFEECVRLNGNYEVAYVGIGKNYLMKDEYEKAMYYFKLGNNRPFYSDAYNGYRGEKIKENFVIVVIVFVVLIGLLIYSEIRYHKKKRPL